MKTGLLKISALLTVFFITLSTASSSLAAEPVLEKESKSLAKIKNMVSNAGPHDWQTLSNCAQKLIRKGKNLDLAYEWLQKSLAINKNTQNLAVMGDYYRTSKMPYEAISYYVESMRLGRSKNDKYQDSETLAKVIEQRKILYKYNN